MQTLYMSYSHKDSNLGRLLTESLSGLGYIIISADKVLTGGDDMRNALIKGLNQADAFIPIISKNSSSSSYLFHEIGAARALKESTKKIQILPVVVDGVDIPAPIEDIYCILSPKREVKDIISQIHRALDAISGRKVAEEIQQEEIRERIRPIAEEYINEAIIRLEKRESSNRSSSNWWYFFGYLVLILGVAFTYFNIKQLYSHFDNDYLQYLLIGLKNLLIIGLLIASSKYAFTMGKTYLTEALRSADRIHAISFGRFYLRAYGDTATWQELKEAFQHWNIDKASSLMSADASSFDPKVLETISEVSKLILSNISKK